jgi:hypothetical protein
MIARTPAVNYLIARFAADLRGERPDEASRHGPRWSKPGSCEQPCNISPRPCGPSSPTSALK